MVIPPGQFLSTSLSDAVLCGVAVWCIKTYSHPCWWMQHAFSAALTSLATAAGVGAIRFLEIPALRGLVVPLHGMLTWVATVVGVPFVFASMSRELWPYLSQNVQVLSAGAILGMSLAARLYSRRVGAAAAEVPGALAVGIALVSLAYHRSFLPLAGLLAFALAGKVVGVSFTRRVAGLRSVDAFHYALAAGVVAVSAGVAAMPCGVRAP